MITQHEIEVRVRYQETDAMGILHHAAYLTYFEIGRTELLRANGVSYRELEAQGVFLVVARIKCSYHRPARYDDVLTLQTTTTRVSAAKIEHDYRVLRDGAIIAEAQSVLGCVDRSGQPQRIPAWLRDPG